MVRQAAVVIVSLDTHVFGGVAPSLRFFPTFAVVDKVEAADWDSIDSRRVLSCSAASGLFVACLVASFQFKCIRRVRIVSPESVWIV